MDIPFLVLQRIFDFLPDRGVGVVNVMLSSSGTTRRRCLREDLIGTVMKKHADMREFIYIAAAGGFTHVLYARDLKFTTLQKRLVLDIAITYNRPELALKACESGATLTPSQIVKHYRYGCATSVTLIANLPIPFTANHFTYFLNLKSQRETFRGVRILLDELNPTSMQYDFKLAAAIIFERQELIDKFIAENYPVTDIERLLMTQQNNPTICAAFWDTFGFPTTTPSLLIASRCSTATIHYLAIKNWNAFLVDLAKCAVLNCEVRILDDILGIALPLIVTHRVEICNLALDAKCSPVLRVLHRYGFEHGVVIKQDVDAVLYNSPDYLALLISMGMVLDKPDYFLHFMLALAIDNNHYAPVLMALRKRSDYDSRWHALLRKANRMDLNISSIMWKYMVQPIR